MVTLNPERISELVAAFRVAPGSTVRLPRDFDPAFRFRKDPASDKELKKVLRAGIELLAEYQMRLAAESSRGVIVVLQAMDAAGKDGTIRHVMSGVNPQGVSVNSFKAPSAEELSHDYLWRYARDLPTRGRIGIFNRSHYEEVLVVRVHPQILDGQKLPPGPRKAAFWGERFREINNWEEYLTKQGYRFVKLFLNVSKEEQRRRFLARIDTPDKNWKFSANDIRERQYWDSYQDAFADVLSRTSTKWAPWYVVPADSKPFARTVAAAILAHTLIEMDPRYPRVAEDAHEALVAARVDLVAEGPIDPPAPEADSGRKRRKAGKKGGKGKKGAKAAKSGRENGATAAAAGSSNGSGAAAGAAPNADGAS